MFGLPLGLLYTAGAAGALAASLLLPLLVRRVPVGRITLYALLINPLCLLGVALAPAFGPARALYARWSAARTLIIINGITLRRQVVPDHLQSRVNATARMIAWGGTPFGAMLGGLLAEGLPIRLTLIVVGGFVTISVVLGWFSRCAPPRRWPNHDGIPPPLTA